MLTSVRACKNCPHAGAAPLPHGVRLVGPTARVECSAQISNELCPLVVRQTMWELHGAPNLNRKQEMSARDDRRLSRGYRRAVESRSRIRYRLRLEANLACNVLELSECQTCSR